MIAGKHNLHVLLQHTTDNMPNSPTSDRNQQYQVLDPTLLGRPVHLLPRFATRLAEAFALAMRKPARRRYWDAFDLDKVEFTQAPETPGLRWLAVPGPLGAVAVAFERPLLLALLDWRYGRNPAALIGRDVSTERVTATEERLAVVLTQQLVEVLYARVGAALAEVGHDAGELVPDAPASGEPPPAGSWAIRLELRGRGDAPGQAWLALDQPMLASILRALLPERRLRKEPPAAEPLATRLQVKLDGRLVRMEINLAALFRLKVGDVIPVSVGRADVLLDENRLFTAAVAEHKGKLCLTSFEDAE
jgi:flagellar motor switch protein FliM